MVREQLLPWGKRVRTEAETVVAVIGGEDRARQLSTSAVGPQQPAKNGLPTQTYQGNRECHSGPRKSAHACSPRLRRQQKTVVRSQPLDNKLFETHPPPSRRVCFKIGPGSIGRSFIPSIFCPFSVVSFSLCRRPASPCCCSAPFFHLSTAVI